MLVPALGEENNLRNVEKANNEVAEERMNKTICTYLIGHIAE